MAFGLPTGCNRPRAGSVVQCLIYLGDELLQAVLQILRNQHLRVRGLVPQRPPVVGQAALSDTHGIRRHAAGHWHHRRGLSKAETEGGGILRVFCRVLHWQQPTTAIAATSIHRYCPTEGTMVVLQLYTQLRYYGTKLLLHFNTDLLYGRADAVFELLHDARPEFHDLRLPRRPFQRQAFGQFLQAPRHIRLYSRPLFLATAVCNHLDVSVQAVQAPVHVVDLSRALLDLRLQRCRELLGRSPEVGVAFR
mmetsp:Transcript_97808/g.245082  ORF Transcript_97808/g.245082 Transcript_97808/m.245082 type:complete len:250 (-) Transcript_97808:716-1465(-)